MHENFKPLFEEKGTYATDLFTRESIKIINTHDRSVPLFLYLSHLAAHTGANGTELGTPDPNEAQQKYSYIKNERRRLYADVVNRYLFYLNSGNCNYNIELASILESFCNSLVKYSANAKTT